jgi:hypothetical protein
VVEAPVLTPIVIQAEDAARVAITDVPGTGTGAVTRIVTATTLDDFGNFRAGSEGGAYLDFGTTPGDRAVFTVDAPSAGLYTATIRYANGGLAARPLNLTVNGAAASQIPFAPTSAVTPGGEPWEGWTEITVQVQFAAGANTFALTLPTAAQGGVANGPNIDRITFTPLAAPQDTTADADGNLAVAALDGTVEPGEAGAVQFRLTGVDADVVAFEISLDGGATRIPVTPVSEGGGSWLLTASLTGLPLGTVQVRVYVKDAAGNEAPVQTSVTLAPAATPAFFFEVQGEALTIADTGTLDTVVRDPNNRETNLEAGPDGLWDGFSGSGYLDMGGQAGDAASFTVQAGGRASTP